MLRTKYNSAEVKVFEVLMYDLNEGDYEKKGEVLE